MQPIRKGRISTPVSKFLDKTTGKEKNRFATIGYATEWQDGISIDLDTLPIGHSGTLHMKIFWDDDKQGQQPQAQQYQQPAQQTQQYQQPAQQPAQQTQQYQQPQTQPYLQPVPPNNPDQIPF